MAQIRPGLNVVGTVAEAGGIPTGAIIERGENANGVYIKYADGTLLVMMQDNVAADGGGYYYVTDQPYPATFSSTQQIFVTGYTGYHGTSVNGVASVYGYRTNSMYRSGVKFGSSVVGAYTINIRTIVYGRWFEEGA